MEIERKWLIDENNIPYNLNDYEFWDIEQAYISFEPTIRIRKISNKNEFILTIKSSSKDEDGLAKQEYEINISEDQYNDLLQKREGIVLEKTRYRVKDDYLLEIDIFHNEYEGLAYMEVEFENIEQAKAYMPPKWVGKELTNDHRYSNASLARGTFKI